MNPLVSSSAQPPPDLEGQLVQARRPAAERHVRRAATHEVPTCARCGARMVLRTGQSGARKGQKFWGCSNYPACRYTKNMDDEA